MGRIKFKVNGVEHSVGCEVDSKKTLVDYLREDLEYRGTKYMCREGGCGACIVAAVKFPGGPTLAVNSCMISITSCQDWEITTIEEIGNRKKGYSILQKTLADHNGIQCGYCSPAWIMNLYSLLQNGNKPTMLEIERAFGSNVCRCTGFRPILDAFKEFGSDAPKIDKITDIEDLKICKKNNALCKKTSCSDDEWCIVEVEEGKIINIKLKDGKSWFKVFNLTSLFNLLKKYSNYSYMLVHGNTAKGAYPIKEYPDVLIDISSIKGLKNAEMDQNLILGAGLTLTELRDNLKKFAKAEYFGYLDKLNEHMRLVAHIPVRNVMPRSENAHAVVNAGFLYKLSCNYQVIEARIVYGGLSPSFTRAYITERFLIGKSLYTNETLQSALKILQGEVVVTENPPEPSVEYRTHLALALFYKGIINLCPKNILNERYLSEGIKIRNTRPLSKGTQTFDTNPSLWPLNQPIPKVDALIQSAGESKYTDDIPTQPHEVHAALALTTVARGDIVTIDANKALQLPGVIAFYTAKDIPGLNSFVPVTDQIFVANEEVLCSGNVKYYNQPYGIIVAETRHAAETAAGMVNVTYNNIKPPVIDVKEAVKDPARVNFITKIDATERGTDVARVIKGENTFYGQYHFTMENISALTRPTEEGVEVFVTSQWMDATQTMISEALKMDKNRIDIHVRRVGGAFGIKITRPIRIAVLSSLVTTKLNRPCRFVVPLTTTTRAMGKRIPSHTAYVCEVNSSGVIQHIDYNFYSDPGYKKTEDFTIIGTTTYYNCYNMARWNYKSYDVITDTAKNTWCRGPGSLENIAMAERLLERISYELGLDPFEVRLANIDTTKYNDIKEMALTLKETASYSERRSEVDSFNANNRWRKRGLRFAFSRWYCLSNLVLDINLTAFHLDGTVIITHGGIEMGQGINTKAIQIAAYFLKIPISKIQVKPNNTIIAPNGYSTGGSIGSQDVGIGVRRCCEKLLERLEPIRSKMNNPTWEELINQAFKLDVDLQVHDYVGAKDAFFYDIFGVALAEVEVDILTGESQIRRVDILQDVGQSVSPQIDMGQVEGAFVMGQGYWTCEKLVYDKNTGELLTDRTWNYYVPLATDIAQDFRVRFRENSYGIAPLLGAKATGEPPICLSIVITFALREAMAHAREESGLSKTEWFQIDGPYSNDKVALLSASKIEDFKLY